MMPTRDTEGRWSYPRTEEVLKKAGLFTIDHYVTVRRTTILKFIADRPIYELCRRAERQRGTGAHQYWWEQPMALEDTSPATATEADPGGFAGI
jgi:hypothetical protein